MRIIAFGDIHMQTDALTDIPSLAEADWVLLTGDLTNFGGDREARKILADVSRFNKHIWALAGNLDQKSVDRYLSENKLNLHGHGVFIDDVGLMGLGGSNITPFRTPNEFSESEIRLLLEKGYNEVREAERIILVSHTPPYGTLTDRLNDGTHVGSPAVREWIEKYRPALCLTGHIHEAVGEDRLGETQIINPGMFGDGRWIEIEITGSEIKAGLQGKAYDTGQCL